MNRRHVAAAALVLMGVPVLVGIERLDPPGHDSHGDHAPAARPPAPKAPAKPAAKSGASQESVKITLPKAAPQPARAAPMPEPMDAESALDALRDGNMRWATNTPAHPNTESSRRQSVEGGQKPFVTVLTCADSRIPVERVFDRGVGDVFVVRVAGNVAGVSETATVEYGVEHLHTPLLVVMGHTRCGAVAAAASGAEVHGMVARLLEGIEPAVERARRMNPELSGDALAAAAVRENVWQTIFDLYKSSEACRGMVQAGELTVVGAVYDIATGRVEWLGRHPWEIELIDAIATRNSHGDAHAGGHDGDE